MLHLLSHSGAASSDHRWHNIHNKFQFHGIAPASFKSDEWKQFGFLVWRNEKGENATESQKNNTQTITNYTLYDFTLARHSET